MQKVFRRNGKYLCNLAIYQNDFFKKTQKLPTKNENIDRTSWWSTSGYTVLPVKGAWVQFLVRELDPIHYKTGITKEIKEIKKN